MKLPRFLQGEAPPGLQAWGPYLAVAVPLAVLWALVLSFSVLQEQRYIQSASQQLRLINSAVAQETEGLLQGVESNLAVLGHWVSAHPEADPRQDTRLSGLMQQLGRTSGGLVRYALAGEAELPGPARSGQPHLGPAVRHAADQPWQWPMSLRLAAPAGDVAGVVAWIDLARLSALHEALREKPAGAITITTRQGVVILRTPAVEGLVGRDIAQVRPGVPWTADSPAQGTYQHSGTLTSGQPRLASYEKLSRYEVTLVISQEVDEILAAFYRRRNIGVGALVFISACGLAFAAVLARSQRATRRSRAEFAALSASFPLGLFRADMQGATTYANEAYFRKFAIPPERLAWGWNEVVVSERPEQMLADWKQAVAQSVPVRSVLTVRHPDGTHHMLAVRTAPLWLDGKPVGQVGSVQDITERLQQQRAQRMLTAIFEQTTDMVAQLSPEGRVVYLNPAGRRVLGIGPAEPVEHLHYDHFVPAHRELQVRDEIIASALAQGLWLGETSVLTTDGRELDMSEMLIVHRDKKGQIENYSLVMRDISADKRARMELQRSQSVLKIVAATLPALVAVVDRHQRYLFTNDAFDRWLKRPSGTLVGMSLRAAVGEREYAHRQPHIEAALAGERVSFESALDDQRHFEVTYIPFRGADGQVAGFVSLSQDITAHKQRQQMLLDASHTDPLTGVLNRAGFGVRAQQALDDAQAQGRPLALLCLDIDRFKPVNDEHGHAVGDALLVAVAQRLQGSLRPGDLLARLGGDEFTVVLPEVKDAEAARTVAAKIVAALGEPFRIEGRSLTVGASVGLALLLGPGDKLHSLMQRADAALYQAKRAGRGRYEMAANVA